MATGLYGAIASSGASQGGIGTSVTTSTYSTTTNVTHLTYGGGFWFGGRTTTVYKADIKAAFTTSSYAGHGNSNCKPKYINGYFFLPDAGSGTWRYSTDLSVTPTSGTTFGTYRVTTAEYFNGKYYIFQDDAVSSYMSSTSISGTWTTTSNATNFKNGVSCAATNGTTLVVLTNGGDGMTTTDGTTWSALTTSFGTTGITNVIYDKESGYFVATGSSGKAAYSQDGTTWTQITVGLGTSEATTAVKCNARWIIAAQSATTQIKFSKSDSSLPTGTFTAGSSITIGTSGLNSLQISGTDGNHMAFSSGSITVYTR